MKLSFSLFAISLLTGAFASNVLELVPDNFDNVIGQGKPGLVEFFAPWCGHCKNLAPVYEQLADSFAHAKDKVIVAKVDADGVGRPLGEKYGVKGYPTLIWFDAEGNDSPYDNQRDLDSLAAFITSQSGVKSNIKPPPPPATLILDTHTFSNIALSKDKDVLVAFTAPWCGHCKRLKPIYEEVAKDFTPESNCIVANVDADAEKNRDLALKYSISSFPTIMFFPKGDEEPEDYSGDRTEQAFVNFLNEKCGTFRAVGGGLNEQAGRHPEFDSLANKFFVATGDARDVVFKEASVLAAQVGPVAKHYLRVMEKVVNGTEDYITKETQRLASILKKRTLSPAKLDEIQIKANVLSAFAPVTQKEDDDVIKRSKEEL